MLFWERLNNPAPHFSGKTRWLLADTPAKEVACQSISVTPSVCIDT
ncbi:hypothetical protein [Coleofasciculus sp. FACHB-SPT9]|nr:hypothetical protein [Coleofasciculus sp. FACHB-SPT9]MBD1888526.1 hypothetical protein [Coleofasciculus sp. FACHB-SPT9]